MATTTNTTSHAPAIVSPRSAIPPLEPGDVLTAEEFERRWEAMPDLKHAELINGVVYMNAAISVYHAFPHVQLIQWIAQYATATPGLIPLLEPSVRLEKLNEPQPDCMLMIDAECGGQAKVVDGYVRGAPELVAEIAATTASYDLHAKLDVYRRFGVREYIVWRTYDQAIDWFVLRNERFEPLAPSSAGRYQSTICPGLWLDAAALLRNDMLTVLKVLQEGIATPEHAAFAQKLTVARPAT
jgi:Uma2 family endonuclease